MVVVCQLENQGNTFLENVEVCIEKDCKKVDVGIGSKKLLNFTVEFKELGVSNLWVTAVNKKVTKESAAEIALMPLPNLRIENITINPEINYEDSFPITFVLASESPVQKVVVELHGKRRVTKIDLTDFSEKKKIILNAKGSDLDPGKNTYELKVMYDDLEGKSHKTSEEFVTELAHLSVWQKIKLWCRNFLEEVKA